MLSEKTLQAIADRLKVKVDDLSSAVKSEQDVDLTIPELTVFTSDELKLHDENLKKSNYESAKTAGEEMLIKNLKEKTGIKIEGKDPDKFISALKNQILEEAKIEPSKKIEELQGDIDKLKANLKTAEEDKNSLKNQIVETSLQQKIFAGSQKEAILPAFDIYTLMKSKGYSFAEENGKITVSQFDKPLKDDKTLEPLSGIDIFDRFIEENSLAKQEGGKTGRGNKSTQTTTGITKLSELEEKYKSEGKSVNGAEFMAEAAKLAKENKDFLN
ncbi:MAG: hypothetical protein LBK94_13430 [Prevotellaceae bacterium]|jgi:hypothetical protein|nr:hypothetical protein [Prevotellaceae bacterium]